MTIDDAGADGSGLRAGAGTILLTIAATFGLPVLAVFILTDQSVIPLVLLAVTATVSLAIGISWVCVRRRRARGLAVLAGLVVTTLMYVLFLSWVASHMA